MEVEGNNKREESTVPSNDTDKSTQKSNDKEKIDIIMSQASFAIANSVMPPDTDKVTVSDVVAYKESYMADVDKTKKIDEIPFIIFLDRGFKEIVATRHKNKKIMLGLKIIGIVAACGGGLFAIAYIVSSVKT